MGNWIPMENVRKREKTLFYLFLRQVIGIAVAVILEIVIFLTAFSVGLNAGIILPANYTENYLLQIAGQIANSNPFSKEILPENCEYGLFDITGTYIEGNSENVDKLANVLMEESYQNGYKIVNREDGYCVIHYSVEARFSNPTLYKIFPHLEIMVMVLFFVIFLFIIAVNAIGFGKKLQRKLTPLLDEIHHIKEKELFLSSTRSDIREFNEVLSALDEMKAALANSLKKEWETEQRRKENISALAHDVKTPLTIIKGNVELLKEETSLEQIYAHADVINDNTDRIEHYIRLLINETKGIREVKETSLSELISDIKVQSEILCNTKKIPILIEENVLNFSERQIADSDRILRAVLNIVANAIEYTNPKRGIRMYLGEEKEEIFIKVEDFGEGFSKEALLHATEQFYTEKKERSGTHYGLGLYFSKNVAREQEGKICINNKTEGNGAEVTFYFKVK